MFQINGVRKEPLQLPEPDGETVTLNEKVYVPVKEHPDVSRRKRKKLHCKNRDEKEKSNELVLKPRRNDRFMLKKCLISYFIRDAGRLLLTHIPSLSPLSG